MNTELSLLFLTDPETMEWYLRSRVSRQRLAAAINGDCLTLHHTSNHTDTTTHPMTIAG